MKNNKLEQEITELRRINELHKRIKQLKEDLDPEGIHGIRASLFRAYPDGYLYRVHDTDDNRRVRFCFLKNKIDGVAGYCAAHSAHICISDRHSPTPEQEEIVAYWRETGGTSTKAKGIIAIPIYPDKPLGDLSGVLCVTSESADYLSANEAQIVYNYIDHINDTILIAMGEHFGKQQLETIEPENALIKSLLQSLAGLSMNGILEILEKIISVKEQDYQHRQGKEPKRNRIIFELIKENGAPIFLQEQLMEKFPDSTNPYQAAVSVIRRVNQDFEEADTDYEFQRVTAYILGKKSTSI